MGAQIGWRWCSLCQNMVYGGAGNGVCFDEESHYLNDSGPYVLTFGETPAGAQDGWRWCRRCQVLVYGGFGAGICHDGQPHDFTGSGAYSVAMGAIGQAIQDGWRWCSRCQVLMYIGFSNGMCWDGNPHYPNDSGAYGVPFEQSPQLIPSPPPQPAPRPVQPRIEVSEVAGQIAARGEQFTPGGRVRLSFVRNADVKKLELIATEHGRIEDVETALDPQRIGGAIVATDLSTQAFVLGATKRLFPFVSRPVRID